MAEYTTNYNLTKPLPSELYNVEHYNQNFEKLDTELLELDTKVGQLSEKISDFAVPVNYPKFRMYAGGFTRGYCNRNGVLYPSDTGTLGYTEIIHVHPGDVIRAYNAEMEIYLKPCNMQFVTAYSGENPVSDAYVQNVRQYIVPDGIDGVRLSMTNAFHDYYKVTRIEIETDSPKRMIKREPLGAWRITGDLGDGESFDFPENHVSNDVVFSFSGDVQTMGTLIIGSINGDELSGRIEIDATTLKVISDGGNVNSFSHGLAIENNLQCVLETGTSTGLKSLTVYSNGNSYAIDSPELRNYGGAEGHPIIKSDGCVLTNCSASWTSRKINKPIWLFGDSYMTWYSSRWIYYAAEKGYDDSFMLSAFAGEGSVDALDALKNLIGIARPQYIVWGLGMNNKDSDAEVDPTWLWCYEQMLEICAANAITPILATIPNTPTRSNFHKNSIVRESGHRYIDFAAAVGASEVGSGWYTGMLNADNVHPTSRGAKALYVRAVTDFPEITNMT